MTIKQVEETRFEKVQKMKIEMLANKLDSKAQTLIRDMQSVRDKIANGSLDRLNTLGEVQGVGSDVDNLCGQIRALLGTLEDYKLHDEL